MFFLLGRKNENYVKMKIVWQMKSEVITFNSTFNCPKMTLKIFLFSAFIVYVVTTLNSNITQIIYWNFCKMYK